MKKILLIAVALSLLVEGYAQETPLLSKYRGMALEYNPDLKAAEKNISASIELEQSARADLKPKLSAGANFQYTGNPIELTLDLPALGSPMSFTGRDLKYGASLSLMQPIYTGGRILETIKMAELQQSYTRSRKDVVRSSVCFQTDIQYWNTVARQELVGVATDFRSSIFSLVGVIKERVDAGLIDPQDLLMAEVKLNEADYQLLQTKSNFEIGRMALNSLIGTSLTATTEIDSQIPSTHTKETFLPTDVHLRPEIKMAHESIKMQESALRLTDSKYKPQFYIGADGSYSSPGYDFNKDLDPNYAVYAKISIPLFEWGKRKNEKRASKHQIGMAKDQLQKVEDAVSLEVETARVAWMQALDRSRLSESSLQKARENERQALERYNEGKASIVEVIEAQIYKQTAQINHVQAKLAVQTNYSDLLRATNGYDIQ